MKISEKLSLILALINYSEKEYGFIFEFMKTKEAKKFGDYIELQTKINEIFDWLKYETEK